MINVIFVSHNVLDLSPTCPVNWIGSRIRASLFFLGLAQHNTTEQTFGATHHCLQTKTMEWKRDDKMRKRSSQPSLTFPNISSTNTLLQHQTHFNLVATSIAQQCQTANTVYCWHYFQFGDVVYLSGFEAGACIFWCVNWCAQLT